MNQATDNTTVPTDAVTSASNWSKVSKRKTKNYSLLYWLVGGMIVVILVLSLSSHKATQAKSDASQTSQATNFSASLNANLARLQELAKQKTSQIPQYSFQPFAQNNIATAQKPSQSDLKAYLARQNAPTSMYTSNAQQPVRTSSANHVEQTTFAGKGPNTQFGNTQTQTTAVQATRIAHPEATIAAGEFMHAALETAINSDLPGMVRAIVSTPVYAYTGGRLMVPAGSRLIGQYASALIQGQHRVMIIWQRVLLPNGIAVQINSPGADALGRAGQGADSINTHFLARFGESALLSLMGAASATAGVNNGDQYNSAAQYRMAIAQSFQQSAQKSLQGTLPIKPTLHIYQGTPITVFVAHDLNFYNVLKPTDVPLQTIPSWIK